MERSALLGLCACVALAGCGGGGGSPAGVGSSTNFNLTGQAVITVNWSANRGVGVFNSVRAIVSDRGREVGSGLLTRPAQGASSSLSLNGLPAGSLDVLETAYATADGSGAGQPLGSETITIAPGGVTHVSVGDSEATHFVSPNGNDSNAGSAASPWKTLQKAAAAVKPGSTVVIADGEYPGGVTISKSGTSAAPIVFRAENPGGAIIRGDQTSAVDAVLVTKAEWVVIDGLAVTRGKRGIRVDQSNHVTVRRCRCHDNEVQGIFSNYSDDLTVEYNECVGTRVQHGIYVSNGGDRPIVRFNTCRDNARSGIQLNGDGKMVRADLGTRGDGIIEGAVVANNVISNCGLDASNRAAAINLACVRGSLIAGNLLYNNYGSGIALFNDNAPGAVQWGSKDNQILQNTVYFRAGEGRWCVSMKNGSTGNRVMNNLLVGGHGGPLEFDGRSSFVSDGNLCFSYAGPAIATKADAAAYFTLDQWRTTSSNDKHSATTDPGFGSPASTDSFRLRPGNPAIGVGVPISIPLADLDGRPFGASGRWNAGCFAGG